MFSSLYSTGTFHSSTSFTMGIALTGAGEGKGETSTRCPRKTSPIGYLIHEGCAWEFLIASSGIGLKGVRGWNRGWSLHDLREDLLRSFFIPCVSASATCYPLPLLVPPSLPPPALFQDDHPSFDRHLPNRPQKINLTGNNLSVGWVNFITWLVAKVWCKSASLASVRGCL